MAEKELQKSKLQRLESNFVLVAMHSMMFAIQAQLSCRQNSAPVLFRAPEQCSHARQKFSHVKWFGQIIIGAGIEPQLPLDNLQTTGQDKNGSVASQIAEVLQQMNSVHFRQPQVKYDKLVGIISHEFQRALSCQGHID